MESQLRAYYKSIEDEDAFIARATSMILAKDDAGDVITYKNKMQKPIIFCNQRRTFSVPNYYQQWWLTTAVKLNHLELVNLLLAEPTCKFGAPVYSFVHSNLMRPLLVSIETGNVELVRSFLQKCSPSDWTRADFFRKDLQCDGYFSSVRGLFNKKSGFHERLSAVEYACLVNQPDVLKLILTEFSAWYQPRSHSDLDFDANFDQLAEYGIKVHNQTDEEWHSTPLHSIIGLGSKIFGEKLASLPSFVQLVIDAGGNHYVHCLDACGLTPLQLLMKTVQKMIPVDEEVATEHRRIILQVTEVLLKAGSKVNTPTMFKDKNSEPLSLLMRGLIFIYERICIVLDKITALEEVRAIRNNIRLVEELAKLLLVHGADPLRDQYDIKTMAAASYTLIRQNKTINNLSTSSVFDEIKHSLATIFKYFILAGGTNCFMDDNFLECPYTVTDELWEGEFPRNLRFANFFLSLVTSDPGRRSDKLTKIMLNALSGSNVRKLALFLSDYREQVTLSDILQSDHDQQVASIDRTITLVESVEIPRRLDFIASRTINRDLSKISLALLSSKSDQDLSLSVPRHLVPHILLQTTDGNGE